MGPHSSKTIHFRGCLGVLSGEGEENIGRSNNFVLWPTHSLLSGVGIVVSHTYLGIDTWILKFKVSH